MSLVTQKCYYVNHSLCTIIVAVIWIWIWWLKSKHLFYMRMPTGQIFLGTSLNKHFLISYFAVIEYPMDTIHNPHSAQIVPTWVAIWTWGITVSFIIANKNRIHRNYKSNLKYDLWSSQDVYISSSSSSTLLGEGVCEIKIMPWANWWTFSDQGMSDELFLKQLFNHRLMYNCMSSSYK